MKNINMKFRGCLFGGFRRKDVAEYIGKLASEKQSLEKENEKSKEKISSLEKKIAELERKNGETAALPVVREPKAEEKTEPIIAPTVVQQKVPEVEVVAELEKSFAATKADIDVSTAHMKCELKRMEDQLTALMQSMVKTEERIRSLRK